MLHSETPGWRLVQEVDELIRSGLLGVEIDVDVFALMLIINSYYSFLGAVRVALSGQAVAIFPLLRHGLECACYAHAISQRPELADVWKDRHRSEETFKACRNAFAGAVADTARSVGERQPELGSLINDTYQASIDFGAHPNARSLLLHTSIRDVEEGTAVNLTCLYGERDVNLQAGLVACAEVGIASAFVCALAVRNHPLIDEGFAALGAIYTRVHAANEELSHWRDRATPGTEQ